jgi:hypothetical protein
MPLRSADAAATYEQGVWHVRYAMCTCCVRTRAHLSNACQAGGSVPAIVSNSAARHAIRPLSGRQQLHAAVQLPLRIHLNQDSCLHNRDAATLELMSCSRLAQNTSSTTCCAALATVTGRLQALKYTRAYSARCYSPDRCSASCTNLAGMHSWSRWSRNKLCNSTAWSAAAAAAAATAGTAPAAMSPRLLQPNLVRTYVCNSSLPATTQVHTDTCLLPPQHGLEPTLYPGAASCT